MTVTSPARPATYATLWRLVFGLFLGLSLLKFGNPVVLDRQIPIPAALSELIAQPWPLRWGFAGFALIVVAALPLVFAQGRAALRALPRSCWLPLVGWLVWQFISASRTVDATLTHLALLQFSGIAAAYGLGVVLLSRPTALRWVLVGVTAGFCFCLMRAATQRLVEFPLDREILLEGQRTGWTNFPPATLDAMRREGTLVSTNGVEVANPLLLLKLERGRVHGTLVYPNALAGVILLLFPVAFQMVESVTRGQRSLIRYAALVLLAGLGAAALFWSGSKSGWLIALVAAAVLLLHQRQPVARRKQWVWIALIAGGGLLVFAWRFQGYFAAGATSVGARFDYWRAAGQTALSHPLTGTGPGTFQRPYAQLKAPDAEMARLAHNDYLEQFSDSGWPGGILYLVWILSWLAHVGRWAWQRADAFGFAAALGVAAWLAQGLSEFSLYVPALAWTAFTLAGALAARAASPTASADE